ncbi:MAG: DUF3179 domain-containing protein [Xanthomonadaceae bacterium]|nr:DUF3179 domain-containing protein [Xanthomonadaceae bacterium]MDP2186109.1 DUF3179 domain-containing protein [Xanthomonadales bacterium]MDZ4117504.1 DUF3179 domain-containing protein [Xanthomonadaceae bacterium]MDZ4379424.1 DUF3179 domain-containing protein [Xanthomonadaceae bacterium]
MTTIQPRWRTGLQRLLHDRNWRFALPRIVLLSALGWLLVQQLLPRSSFAGTPEELWPNTDFSRHSVPLDEFEPGGPPKDGIPPIDKPRFAPVSAVDWLAVDAPVIVVQLADAARAYPLEILVWHEIVNDTLGDTPIVVTFCPLCNAALVFDRRVAGETLDFGTTGWLRLSDLVMYDRLSESWWQQFTGEAVAGKMTGAQLVQVPAQIIGFGDFRAAWPSGEVLTRRTGHRRRYGENPYVGYDSMRQNPLMPEHEDRRLRPMERVLAAQIGALQRVYPFTDIAKKGLIHDRIGDTPVVVFARKKGMRSALDGERIARSKRLPAAAVFIARHGDQELTFVKESDAFRDQQTGSHWNLLGHAIDGPLAGQRLQALPGGIHFAFAWLAFKPDSEIYGNAD